MKTTGKSLSDIETEQQINLISNSKSKAIDHRIHNHYSHRFHNVLRLFLTLFLAHMVVCHTVIIMITRLGWAFV